MCLVIHVEMIYVQHVYYKNCSWYFQLLDINADENRGANHLALLWNSKDCVLQLAEILFPHRSGRVEPASGSGLESWSPLSWLALRLFGCQASHCMTVRHVLGVMCHGCVPCASHPHSRILFCNPGWLELAMQPRLILNLQQSLPQGSQILGLYGTLLLAMKSFCISPSVT